MESKEEFKSVSSILNRKISSVGEILILDIMFPSNITREDLHKATNISENRLDRILFENARPTNEEIKAIAEFLKVSQQFIYNLYKNWKKQHDS